VLELMCLFRGERPLRCWGASFTRETNILVIADAVLVEATNSVRLAPAELVVPVVHGLYHLALDLGVGVVELGVEEALEDLLGNMVDIH
jgi:hypothetical protein